MLHFKVIVQHYHMTVFIDILPLASKTTTKQNKVSTCLKTFLLHCLPTAKIIKVNQYSVK